MIPLKSAVLCLDCETISQGRNNRCDFCSSRALLSLAYVLGTTQPTACTAPELQLVMPIELSTGMS
jgi:hypothetical protein